MSLNTTMPYYRNTSREMKTVREIIQVEAIKSARILNKDKVKVKSNNGDLNRSKRQINHSFNDNTNINQNENILQTYLANAFQEQKENLQRIQFQEIHNKNKLEENKQREFKYLMRMAELEKESSKLTEMISKLKKENMTIKQQNNNEYIMMQLQEALNKQKIENQILKKQLNSLQNTNNINTIKKRNDITLNTTTYTINNTFNDISLKQKEYIPSYLLALSLAE